MKREETTIYRCRKGTLHETALEAAECDLKERMATFVLGEDKRFPCQTLLGKKGMGDNAVLTAGEITCVAHWITNNTALLEHLIQSFLDDMAEAQPVTTKKTAES